MRQLEDEHTEPVRDAALIIGVIAGLVLVFSNVWIAESRATHSVLFFIGLFAAITCTFTYLKDHGRWPPRSK